MPAPNPRDPDKWRARQTFENRNLWNFGKQVQELDIRGPTLLASLPGADPQSPEPLENSPSGMFQRN